MATKDGRVRLRAIGRGRRNSEVDQFHCAQHIRNLTAQLTQDESQHQKLIFFTRFSRAESKTASSFDKLARVGRCMSNMQIVLAASLRFDRVDFVP